MNLITCTSVAVVAFLCGMSFTLGIVAVAIRIFMWVRSSGA